MKILQACSEFFPLIKTGGLADVVGALPKYLKDLGCDVRIILPYYPKVKQIITETDEIFRTETFAGNCSLRYAEYEGFGFYLIDAQCFDREGNPYHDQNYRDYEDNFARFALLSWAAASIADGADRYWGSADILHCHDWQTGLAPAYLRHWGSDVASLFTIHNIAYQGIFGGYLLERLWLDQKMFNIEGLEFYGHLSYLKSGIYYSDFVSTVSPTYAQEITRAPAANGLEGLLSEKRRKKRLYGILNGLDTEIWNPLTDKLIYKNYSVKKLTPKRDCKNALRKELGLNRLCYVPLIAMVSRLTNQKGADLLARNIENRLNAGGINFQFVLLGTGDGNLENWFRYLASRDPKNIAVRIGYDEKLSHKIIAAADVFTIPSRFEPCGLTQMYALKYGTLPLVRRTGGLADTVIDVDENKINKNATGFIFDNADEYDLGLAIDRMLKIWEQEEIWKKIQIAGMNTDYSWNKSSLEYFSLYKKILENKSQQF